MAAQAASAPRPESAATVAALAAWETTRLDALARAAEALATAVDAKAGEQAAATARLAGALQDNTALLATLRAHAAEVERSRAARASAAATSRALDRPVAQGLSALAARDRGGVKGADAARLRAALASMVEPYAEGLRRGDELGADADRLAARGRALEGRRALLGAELRRLDEELRAADGALLSALAERGEAASRRDALARHLAGLAERERLDAATPGLAAASRQGITPHDPAPRPRLRARLGADGGPAPALLASAREPNPRRRGLRTVPRAAFGVAAPAGPPAGSPLAPIAGRRVAPEAADGPVHARGILIETGVRQTVSAPLGGRVVFAEPFKGFGLLLIIDPGDGYHMLLSGFSRLGVGRGASVAAGQAVGVIGDPGGKARLYLELRREGSPVDPAAWPALREDRVRS